MGEYQIMSCHLKYYFEKKFNQINLNSIACLDNEDPPVPDNFLKWHEDGDLLFEEPTEAEKAAISKSESPIFMMMFSSKKLNPNKLSLKEME